MAELTAPRETTEPTKRRREAINPLLAELTANEQPHRPDKAAPIDPTTARDLYPKAHKNPPTTKQLYL